MANPFEPYDTGGNEEDRYGRGSSKRVDIQPSEPWPRPPRVSEISLKEAIVRLAAAIENATKGWEELGELSKAFKSDPKFKRWARGK